MLNIHATHLWKSFNLENFEAGPLQGNETCNSYENMSGNANGKGFSFWNPMNQMES